MLTVKDRRRLATCIRHWARLATGTEGEDESIGVKDCALCVVHYHHGMCKGCPVYKDTGKTKCQGTPYNGVVRAANKYGFASKQFRCKAVSMLEYLIRLDQRL